MASKKPRTEEAWNIFSFQYASKHTSLWETARMRSLWIVLVFAAAQALAQGSLEQRGAAEFENRAMADIVDCMVQGLPEEWYRAVMEINLAKPFDETGSVRYAFARREDEPPAEPFQPCDVKRPARTLIDLRSRLPRDRQGWIGAQVTVLKDGRFGIRYGYPKPAAKKP